MTIIEQAQAKLALDLNTYKVDETAKLLNQIENYKTSIKKCEESIKTVEASTSVPTPSLSFISAGGGTGISCRY